MPFVLLLDLDGTLVDSAPDLMAALNRLMDARKLAPFSLAETKAMVGDGVPRLVERAFEARGRAADAAAIEAFSADYAANCAVATRLYPGVANALGELRDAGWGFAVCTNKPERMARALLDALGMEAWFAAIGGGDSFPARKPDPAHLLATLQAAGGEARQAVMVGDHRNDVLGAHGAGLACVFAAWGYGTPAMAKQADAVAARFADLPAMVGRLVRRG